MPEPAEEMGSITDLTERELQEYLFSCLPVRHLFYGELDLPRGDPLLRLKTDEYFPGRGGPGDVDVLVADPNAPEWAVGMECKKVKVKPESFETKQITGLNRASKAVQQTRKLVRLGFSRCYALFFVAIDGRQRARFNFAHRGLTGGLLRRFDAVVRADLFPNEVGVVVLEITQPVEKPLTYAGAAGCRVLRQARPQEQSFGTTAAVRRALAHRA